MAAGQLQLARLAHRLALHESPQLFVAVQFAVVLRSHQHVEVVGSDLCGVVQLVEVPFTVGEYDQLRLGHPPSCCRRLLEGLDPPKTFLFINRLGIAAAFRRGVLRPGPALGIQEA